MVNKKNLSHIVLSALIIQGSLFGMKKEENTSYFIEIPNEIINIIFGFSNAESIKALLQVSTKVHKDITRNKSCITTLKKCFRETCYKKQTSQLDNILEKGAFSDHFQRFSKKFVYLLKTDFFLKDMPHTLFSGQNEDIIIQKLEKIKKNYYQIDNSNISIEKISENNNFASVVNFNTEHNKKNH